MKRTIIIIVTVCFYFSCSPTLYQHNNTEIEKARIHWIGESKVSLVMSWGPPTTKRSDLKGGEIYVYKRSNGFTTWVTNFYIYSSGRIYHLNAHQE